MKRALKYLALLVLAVVALALFATFRTPGHLFVKTQIFADCPARPSCVSSQAKDETHAIEPLRYEGDPAAARAKLEQVIKEMPGASIAHTTPDYVHAVFVTPKMKFHDDLEALVQPDGTVQVRSISRFGYRDWGVNRARVEDLRRRFAG